MGNQDIPLNELGRLQAKATRDRLLSIVIDEIYASDLSRAAETAQIIAAAHGIEPILDTELREINLSGYEGIPGVEMRKAYPHSYLISENEPTKAERPSAQTETRRDLYERSTKAFKRIWDSHNTGTYIVVAHGGVIRCLTNYILQLHAGYREDIFYSQAIDCDNCSITQIRSDTNNLPMFGYLNDVSHLSELES